MTQMNVQNTQTAIMNLNIDIIKMDKYQRAVNMAKVRYIAQNYDPDRDRPIEVSFRDGLYFCFDGQHRVAVHKLLGDKTVLAQVHFGLSFTDECRLFSEQHENEQTVSIRDRWNAAVFAGNKSPQTMEIIRACAGMGYRVSPEHTNRNRTFSCIQELTKIHAKHGVNGLTTMLFVVDTAWKDQPNNTHHDIVAGIGKLMDTYKMGDAEWNRLRDKLSKTTPKEFLRKANTANGRGGKRTAKAMVDLYNSGLSKSGRSRLDGNKIA